MGTSLRMFPFHALFLFCSIHCPLRFPLPKLPLPFLALKKGLNLREQHPGQGLHFMEGNPCAVVVWLLFPCHRSRPRSKAAPRRTGSLGTPSRPR